MSQEFKKQSDQGWGTDAYPAQEPQELEYQKERKDISSMPQRISESFVWVVSGKEIAVVNPESMDQAFSSVGAAPDHHGPLATGTVEISHRWTASFVVKETNIDLDSLHKVFERWAKDPEINFESVNHRFVVSSVVDKNGIPLPVKIRRQASDPGAGERFVDRTWRNTEWGTEIQKRYPGEGDSRARPGDMTNGYECIQCDKVFSCYDDWKNHLTNDHKKGDPTGSEYEVENFGGIAGMERDNEAVTELDGGIHTGSSINGPIAFAYDPDNERIYVNPGGEVNTGNPEPSMAEGYYTPDGDMLIIVHPQEMYAVSSLMGAWLQMHPELEIKHIYLLREEDGTKIKEKVANA
jgi:hypothetical protein